MYWASKLLLTEQVLEMKWKLTKFSFRYVSETTIYGIIRTCTLRDGYTPDALLLACGAQLGREGSLLFGAMGWPQPFPPFPTFSRFLLLFPTLPGPDSLFVKLVQKRGVSDGWFQLYWCVSCVWGWLVFTKAHKVLLAATSPLQNDNITSYSKQRNGCTDMDFMEMAYSAFRRLRSQKKEMGMLQFTFWVFPQHILLQFPNNLLHFPIKIASFTQKMLHFPNSLLHFPNKSLHFPNSLLRFPT